MSQNFALVKKWRLDEWRHPGTRALVGIYVTREGEFYARIPEKDTGELVFAKDKHALILAIKPVADRVFSLVWKRVIRVEMENPERRTYHGNHSYSTTQVKWDPKDPSTAGESVRLEFTRLEVAESPDGKKFHQEWLNFDIPHFNEDRRIESDAYYKQEPGVHVELPYTEEMWAALHDFQQRIRELNHNLRLLLSHKDVGPLLMQASRQKLLAMSSMEEE
jgi:hypothetical protein